MPSPSTERAPSRVGFLEPRARSAGRPPPAPPTRSPSWPGPSASRIWADSPRRSTSASARSLPPRWPDRGSGGIEAAVDRTGAGALRGDASPWEQGRFSHVEKAMWLPGIVAADAAQPRVRGVPDAVVRGGHRRQRRKSRPARRRDDFSLPWHRGCCCSLLTGPSAGLRGKGCSGGSPHRISWKPFWCRAMCDPSPAPGGVVAFSLPRRGGGAVVS